MAIKSSREIGARNKIKLKSNNVYNITYNNVGDVQQSVQRQVM